MLLVFLLQEQVLQGQVLQELFQEQQQVVLFSQLLV
jgi:hypothetical protein